MRNFGLFLLSVVATLVFAYPFGHLLKYFFPLGFAGYIISEAENEFLNGIFSAYFFLLPIIFMTWGRGRKWFKILFLTLPVLGFLFWLEFGYASWAALFYVAGIVTAGVIEQVKKPKRVRVG